MGVFILIFSQTSRNMAEKVTINEIQHSEYIYRPLVNFIFSLFASFCTGTLGYVGRYAWSQSDAYQVFVICMRQILHMSDDMLGPSPMHIKYSLYV